MPLSFKVALSRFLGAIGQPQQLCESFLSECYLETSFDEKFNSSCACEDMIVGGLMV